MKKLAFLLALISWLPLTAQVFTDSTTVSYTEETAEFERQHFVDAYDYVFQNQVPVRWMIKFNAVPYLPKEKLLVQSEWARISSLPTLVSLEFKATQAFSLNLHIGIGSLYYANIENDVVNNFTNQIGLEPRWYYHQKRNILAGKSASNCSGPYVSMGHIFDRTYSTVTDSYRWNYNGTVRWGIQRRIFNHSYIDGSIGAGLTGGQKTYYYSYVNDGKLLPTADIKFSIGWVFANENGEDYRRRNCDFFNCYREEKHLFKIDLYNPLRQMDRVTQQGELSMAYERKINHTPWSVQGSLNMPYFRQAIEPNESKIITRGAQITPVIELRNYFNLRKRIASGKSGDNLSGLFAGMGAAGTVGYFGWKSTGNVISNYQQRFSGTHAIIFMGIQHRIFQKGYFEYKVGGNVFNTTYIQTTYDNGAIANTTAYDKFRFISQLKIGVAF